MPEGGGVGTGILPQSKALDPAFRERLHQLWLDWTDEADADGRDEDIEKILASDLATKVSEASAAIQEWLALPRADRITLTWSHRYSAEIWQIKPHGPHNSPPEDLLPSALARAHSDALKEAEVECNRLNMEGCGQREWKETYIKRLTEFRVRQILEEAARRAMGKIIKERERQLRAGFGHWPGFEAAAERIFASAAAKCCDKFLETVKVKPSRLKVMEEIQVQKVQARKDLAEELRQARKLLKHLQDKVDRAEAEHVRERNRLTREFRNGLAEQYRAQRRTIRMTGETFPAIPAPSTTPSRHPASLPAASGVYFLWNGTAVEYVGKARRLCERVRLGSHHVLRGDHQISYLLFDYADVDWAECYYIGVARPPLNFKMNETRASGDKHSGLQG